MVRRPLAPDEARLWGRVAATARPLHPAPSAGAAPASGPAAPAPEPPGLPGSGSSSRPGPVKHPPVRAPAAPAHQPARAPLLAEASRHKRIRRGRVEIGGRIDLHGMRQVEAEAALTAFILHHRREGARAVLVVTGKGLPVDPGEDYLSPQPGVIRRRLPDWLNSPAIRPHVSGYSEASPRHGGSGAFYVLLKAR